MQYTRLADDVALQRTDRRTENAAASRKTAGGRVKRQTIFREQRFLDGLCHQACQGGALFYDLLLHLLGLLLYQENAQQRHAADHQDGDEK